MAQLPAPVGGSGGFSRPAVDLRREQNKAARHSRLTGLRGGTAETASRRLPEWPGPVGVGLLHTMEHTVLMATERR